MQNITIRLEPTPELLDSLRIVIRSELANYIPPVPIGADLPELLTRKQAAAHLQVSLTTLYSWANDTPERSALLVPQTINGRLRYRRSDVLALQKEHRRFKKGGSAV